MAATPAPGRRRVVVLSGPSGSGKSRLAERLGGRHGWPVVRLDDFYKDLDDPTAPRSDELGIVDWDDPASWDRDAAVSALAELISVGLSRMPVYDISTSRATGWHELTAGPDDLVLAEGIFAAETIGPLRDRGLLHSAWCVHRNPWVTFVLRLTRDLRERRKPALVLLRRGLALRRDEAAVVSRQVALGATAASPREVEMACSPTSTVD